MSLSALIRKRRPADFATATVATLATVQPKTLPTVATVASVAVANDETAKTDNGKPCSRPSVDKAALLIGLPYALPTIPDADDRRPCTQCLNLHGRVCSIAGPGKLVSARQGYQPIRDVPHRCAGYQPNAADTDQRTSGERWPGIPAPSCLKGSHHEYQISRL